MRKAKIYVLFNLYLKNINVIKKNWLLCSCLNVSLLYIPKPMIIMIKTLIRAFFDVRKKIIQITDHGNACRLQPKKYA